MFSNDAPITDHAVTRLLDQARRTPNPRRGSMIERPLISWAKRNELLIDEGRFCRAPHRTPFFVTQPASVSTPNGICCPMARYRPARQL